MCHLSGRPRRPYRQAPPALRHHQQRVYRAQLPRHASQQGTAPVHRQRKCHAATETPNHSSTARPAPPALSQVVGEGILGVKGRRLRCTKPSSSWCSARARSMSTRTSAAVMRRQERARGRRQTTRVCEEVCRTLIFSITGDCAV